MERTNCGYCGAELYRHPHYLKKYATTFCNATCYASHRRTGATDAKGYRVTSINGRLQKVHRIIMAEHLCRPLLRSEVVHHINGDKANNRLENLQIVTHRDHSVRHNERKWNVENAINLRRRGLSLKAVADIIGVSRTNLTKALNARGVK